MDWKVFKEQIEQLEGKENQRKKSRLIAEHWSEIVALYHEFGSWADVSELTSIAHNTLSARYKREGGTMERIQRTQRTQEIEEQEGERTQSIQRIQEVHGVHNVYENIMQEMKRLEERIEQLEAKEQLESTFKRYEGKREPITFRLPGELIAELRKHKNQAEIVAVALEQYFNKQ